MQRPLQLGKRPGRTLAVTSDPGPYLSRLLYVRDMHTHLCFLIDTGSEVSVIPPSSHDRRHPPDKLTLMATYGKRSLTLNLGLRRSFSWVFIVAEVQRAIISADFLRHFGLLETMPA